MITYKFFVLDSQILIIGTFYLVCVEGLQICNFYLVQEVEVSFDAMNFMFLNFFWL